MINFLKVTTIFFLIFHFNSSIAENYEVDQKVTNQFTLNHKFKIDLPDGEWVVAEKPSYEFYGLRVEGYTLLRIENNKVHKKKLVELYRTVRIDSMPFPNPH